MPWHRNIILRKRMQLDFSSTRPMDLFGSQQFISFFNYDRGSGITP